jgi:hypothetical protein
MSTTDDDDIEPIHGRSIGEGEQSLK